MEDGEGPSKRSSVLVGFAPGREITSSCPPLPQPFATLVLSLSGMRNTFLLHPAKHVSISIHHILVKSPYSCVNSLGLHLSEDSGGLVAFYKC